MDRVGFPGVDLGRIDCGMRHVGGDENATPAPINAARVTMDRQFRFEFHAAAPGHEVA